MKELIVKPNYDGKKLNTVLLDTFDGLTLNVLYKTLRKKDIRVNDVKVCENVIVHTGDHLKIYLLDEQLYKKASDFINIVYEDDNIVIVNKPTGIEVTGSHSLTSYLQQFYEQKSTAKDVCISPCHRLDRNTTGLTLFAKNEEALTILLEKFKNREIEKIYRAKVYDIPKVKEQLLKAYLFKDNKKSMVYISDVPKKGYVPISTYYKVIEINKNLTRLSNQRLQSGTPEPCCIHNKKENTSLLEVNLLTGKTHQIRAYLAHVGYPILGDRQIW